jgi:hypothetical protein
MGAAARACALEISTAGLMVLLVLPTLVPGSFRIVGNVRLQSILRILRHREWMEGMTLESFIDNTIPRLSRSFARFYCILPMTEGLRSPVIIARALGIAIAILLALFILVPLSLIFGYSRQVTMFVVLVSLQFGVLVGEHALRAIKAWQGHDNEQQLH